MSLVTKNAVIVSKSFTITHDAIRGFPIRKQLLLLYKRFYKLRIFQEDIHAIKNYETYIRRKFRFEDFNILRSKMSNYREPLAPEELVLRAVNSLAFIQNACCCNAPSTGKKRLLLSVSGHSLPMRNHESMIMKTILNMEYSMPPDIKYDRALQWLDDLSHVLLQIEQMEHKLHNEGKPLNMASLRKSEKVLAHIGYKDYYRNLMGLNESYRLCL